MVRVRLVKKPAAMLNGVDVSSLKVGDVLELPDAAARMMVAEGWAEPAEPKIPTLSRVDQTPARR